VGQGVLLVLVMLLLLLLLIVLVLDAVQEVQLPPCCVHRSRASISVSHVGGAKGVVAWVGRGCVGGAEGVGGWVGVVVWVGRGCVGGGEGGWGGGGVEVGGAVHNSTGRACLGAEWVEGGRLGRGGFGEKDGAVRAWAALVSLWCVCMFVCVCVRVCVCIYAVRA